MNISWGTEHEKRGFLHLISGEGISALKQVAMYSRDARPRVLAWILACIMLYYYIALGGNSGMLAMIGAALSLGTAIITLLVLEPAGRFWKLAWPGLAGLALLNVIAALPRWYNAPWDFLAPDLYSFGMIRLFAATAFMLAGSWVGYRRSGLRNCLLGLVLAGVVDIILGLVLRQFDPIHVWGLSKGINLFRFTGTLLNANASACLFGVTAILATGTLQDSLRYPVRSGIRTIVPLLMIAVTVLAIGACAITGSRTALLLTVLTIATMLVRDSVTRRLIMNPQGILVGGGVTLMLATILLAVGSATFDRVSFLGGDLLERVAIWSRYAEVARDAPLLGYGPASFVEINNLAMRTPSDARLLWYVNSPHNFVLSLLLEHGWMFITALAITALLITVPIFAGYRGMAKNPVQISAIAACLFILLCGSIDIALDVPAVTMLFALLAGLLWGQNIRHRTHSVSNEVRQSIATPRLRV